MASIALGASADVGCRFGLCILGKKNTAVASRALARHARVVHRRGRPGYETADVAGIALRRSRDMHVGFRLRIGEIVGTAMAICTQTHRIDVIHLRRLESRKIRIGVTAIALQRGRNMVGWLAEGMRAVMAGGTNSRNGGRGRGMVESGRRPGGR